MKFFQLDQIWPEVMVFDSSFFEKVWHNIKSLFDPSWMVTYALIFKCLLQHIRPQQRATEGPLQVSMALRHPLLSPPQEVMHAWLSEIQKATS